MMQKQNIYEEIQNYGIHRKRCMQTLSLFPTKANQLSIVLAEREDKTYLFAHVLLLFHVVIAGMSSQVGEYTFVQCFDVTNPIDEVHHILIFLRLRWRPKIK